MTAEPMACAAIAWLNVCAPATAGCVCPTIMGTAVNILVYTQYRPADDRAVASRAAPGDPGGCHVDQIFPGRHRRHGDGGPNALRGDRVDEGSLEFNPYNVTGPYRGPHPKRHIVARDEASDVRLELVPPRRIGDGE